MLAVTFTPYTGIAPGTTTIRPGSELSGLGVCPPGHYGPAIMLPGGPGTVLTTTSTMPSAAPAPSMAPARVVWSPYGTESKLRGLHGVTRLRWDLFALMLGLGFAAVIGYALVKRRK